MDVASIINWVSLIVFYVLIGLFLYGHRKGVTTQWYVFFMYRTKRGIAFIKKLAKAETFWRVYGYVGIPLSFIAMILIFGTILNAVINLFISPQTAAPAASLVVPWGSTGVHGAVITVSIWYFIIAILVTVLVHEGAHAVVAAAHKFKIKSTGFGLFAVIPFAFVEPDEEEIEKSKASKQLSIFAAGPFTNILVAGLVLMLALFIVLPGVANNMQVNGLEVVSINDSMPAGLAGLEQGDLITQVNDVNFVGAKPAIGGLAFTYKSAVTADWPKITPGQTVHIETEDGKSLDMVAASEDVKPSFFGKILLGLGILSNEDFQPRGILGISGMMPIIKETSIYASVFGIMYNILAWIIIFNLGIGLFNLLPIGPLDGGRMLRTLSKSIFKKRGVKVSGVISLFALVTLLLSIFGVYLLKLF